ncbi:hypothetical protein LZ31DRAFT_150899 [Colletotrichum somersetense]|nr:hypothetical protein LZ31DRAFT_150899 [Colletotrichum somersetense]
MRPLTFMHSRGRRRLGTVTVNRISRFISGYLPLGFCAPCRRYAKVSCQYSSRSCSAHHAPSRLNRRSRHLGCTQAPTYWSGGHLWAFVRCLVCGSASALLTYVNEIHT